MSDMRSQGARRDGVFFFACVFVSFQSSTDVYVYTCLHMHCGYWLGSKEPEPVMRTISSGNSFVLSAVFLCIYWWYILVENNLHCI